MRHSRTVKAQSHHTITKEAARLARERGIERTSVADVMQAARMTHGGFYRHFATKDALVAAAIRDAFAETAAMVADETDRGGARRAVRDYLAFYLSSQHVGHPGRGCPIPTLAADVGRGSDELHTAFGEGFNSVIAVIAKGLSGSEEARRAEAIRQIAMRAGAVMIARAADAETGDAVLRACRKD